MPPPPPSARQAAMPEVKFSDTAEFADAMRELLNGPPPPQYAPPPPCMDMDLALTFAAFLAAGIILGSSFTYLLSKQQYNHDQI